MAKLELKYHRTENGYARVYYKDANKKLYCMQEDNPHDFTLYICSKDGEPSTSIDIKLIHTIENSRDNQTTDIILNKWIKDRE